MRSLPLFLTLLLFSCQPAPTQWVEIPHSKEQFYVPQENPISPEKIELGKTLFFEKGLSLDSSISCASCHLPSHAFADTGAVSIGFKGAKGNRNSPTLANLAFRKTYFFDGGINSIERAIHPPLLTDVEMNMNVVELERRLKSNEAYKKAFLQAFKDSITYKNAIFALATYQRTLVSLQAPFDAFWMGDSTDISPAAKRGFLLFKSAKLNCAKCHVPPFFTDDDVHNIGLYKTYADYGHGRLTRDEADFGKMRTPTLRNIAATAPYMHNGSIKSLDEVISFYETGGKNHPNKSAFIQPFSLTEKEKADLISFLKCLTDSAFIAQ